MYSFRSAKPDDFALLKMIHEKTLRPYVELIWGWDEELQEVLLRKKFDPGKLQVIQLGGKDIGILQLERRPDVVFLANLLILPEYQRKGLGSLIIKDIIESAENRPVTLSVLKPNPAKNLYERLGFEVIDQDEIRYKMKRNT
jgi:ribosomal protein S18 acetylase RimI-like enzyme